MAKTALSEVSTWLVISTVVATVGWSMQYGYAIGVLNTPAPLIKAFYNESYNERGTPKTEDEIDFLWSFTVSIFVFAGMIGSFSVGFVADFFGRKRGLMFNQLFLVIGCLLQGLTKTAGIPELLIVGRFFIGINAGLTIGLVAIYLAEIAPVSIRGAIGACNQLCATVGILLAQLLGLKECFGTAELWPVLVAFDVIPGLICLCIFPFCAESQRWLLLHKKDERGARNALSQLRGTENVQDEIEEMEQEAKNASTEQKFTIPMLLKDRSLHKPLFLAILLQFAQQWCGINAVFFYSERIFEGAGLSATDIQWAIVGTGLVNVASTAASVPLLEFLGRKILLIGPMAVAGAALALLCVSINVSHLVYAFKYVSVGSVILFVTAFAIGLGPIPFIVIGELFRQEPRSAAMSVALLINWLCNFTLAMGFVSLQAALGAYTFLLFLFIVILCMVLIMIFLPETKNKTFDSIALMVAGAEAEPLQKEGIEGEADKANMI